MKPVLLTFFLLVSSLPVSTLGDYIPLVSFRDEHSNYLIHLDAKSPTKIGINITSETGSGEKLIPLYFLPLEFLSLENSNVLILGRDFEDERPILVTIKDRSVVSHCNMPAWLGEVIPVTIWQSEINKIGYLIVYDVRNRHNFLAKFSLSSGDCPEFFKSSYHKYRVNSKYQIGVRHFLFSSGGDDYIAAGGSVMKITGNSNPIPVKEFEASYILDALHHDDEVYFLLSYTDLDTRRRLLAKENAVSPYYISTLSNKVRDKFVNGIPTGLVNIDGEVKAETIDNPSLLEKSIRKYWENIDGSGLLDLAKNNAEGRISWSQLYYLHGLLDTIEFEDFFADLNRNAPIFMRELQERLNLELELFFNKACRDRQLSGYMTRRYSYNRMAFHGAVNIGRIAEFVFRLKALKFDVPAACEYRIVEQVNYLSSSWDIFTNKEYYDGSGGFWHLRRKPNTAFIRDGVNLPFNHVSAWVLGYEWELFSDITKITRIGDHIVKDHWTNFEANANALDKRGKLKSKWLYTWGPGYSGWTEKNGVSKNSPTFKGTKNNASTGYLSMDVMALAASAFVQPELVNKALIRELHTAQSFIEKGLLFPYASTWFIRKNKNEVKFDNYVGDLFAVPANASQLREAIWSWAILAQRFSGKRPNIKYVSAYRPNFSAFNRVFLDKNKSMNLLELADLPDDFDNVQIYDAHMNRGYFVYEGDFLLDRTLYTFDGNDADKVYFVSALNNNDYDEIKIRISKASIWSDWHRVKVIVKENENIRLNLMKKESKYIH